MKERLRNKKWLLVFLILPVFFLSGLSGPSSGRGRKIVIPGESARNINPGSPRREGDRWQEEEDSLIWRVAEDFSRLFNAGDTMALKLLLPEDFMLQWMHENFLTRKTLINAMKDEAVHASFRHRLERDTRAIILYSDDRKAACLNTGFVFLDTAQAAGVKKEHNYGVCILYFQKSGGAWYLKTIHFDLH